MTLKVIVGYKQLLTFVKFVFLNKHLKIIYGKV